MFIYIARLIVVILAPIFGYLKISPDSKGILIGTAIAVGVILIEIIIQKVPLDDIIAAAIGITMGLIAAWFFEISIVNLFRNDKLKEMFSSVSLLTKIIFSYIGMLFAIRKKGELDLLDKKVSVSSKYLFSSNLKVVDNSAIIDGRIADIGETGFLEGVLIIPRFILNELHTLADAQDFMKRARGRRGLDILKKLQENKRLNIKIYEKDYSNIPDVDGKLLKLADELKAQIITTDYNLNKIGSLQGVKILNVNELSNAVKPVVLPGETLDVFILKEGKEKAQGLAYLDDGTMVVVESGRKFIGQKKRVIVNSILQTDAGRMIFARLDR